MIIKSKCCGAIVWKVYSKDELKTLEFFVCTKCNKYCKEVVYVQDFPDKPRKDVIIKEDGPG